MTKIESNIMINLVHFLINGIDAIQVGNLFFFFLNLRYEYSVFKYSLSNGKTGKQTRPA